MASNFRSQIAFLYFPFVLLRNYCSYAFLFKSGWEFRTLMIREKIGASLRERLKFSALGTYASNIWLFCFFLSFRPLLLLCQQPYFAVRGVHLSGIPHCSGQTLTFDLDPDGMYTCKNCRNGRTGRMCEQSDPADDENLLVPQQRQFLPNGENERVLGLRGTANFRTHFVAHLLRLVRGHMCGCQTSMRWLQPLPLRWSGWRLELMP